MVRECARSESIIFSVGLASILQANPIGGAKGTYSSIVTQELRGMVATTVQFAIAELARLMLALSPVTIIPRTGNPSAKLEFANYWLADSRILEISEIVPSLVINVATPQYSEGTVHHLSFYTDARLIAVVGEHKPASLDAIWIPIDSKRFSELLCDNLIQLAEAGYPGCEGCLGPAFDREWDERAHRELLLP